MRYIYIYIYAYFDINTGIGFPTEHFRCQHDVFCFWDLCCVLWVKAISKYLSHAQKPYSCSGYIRDLWSPLGARSFSRRGSCDGIHWGEVSRSLPGATKRVIVVSHRFKDGLWWSRDGDYPREWAVDVGRLLDGCLGEGRDSIRETMGPSLMEF